MRREGFREGFREERGEEDGVWDFFRARFWGEGYRNRERGFRVGIVAIEFAFHNCGKNFGLLILLFNLINVFFII